MSDDLAPIEVFCSYASEDESLFQQLQKHLSLLTRQEGIVLWHRRQITPGTDWAQTIDTQVDRAWVILLLISADFLNSDYCYGVEMKRAMARQSVNEAYVIPILLRPVDWEKAPFKHLSILPANGIPITLWSNQDDAYKSVVQSIRTALDSVQSLTFRTPPSAFPCLWNVPYPPNPFFTGQEALLALLASTFKTGQTMTISQPQAIGGLGGIGKTQIAVEYAYRHQRDYQAIFWVNADTHEAVVSGLIALAQLLRLPQRDEHDQTIIVQAVEQWLKTHRGWLLILDNADDLSLISSFLRSPLGGHILLTTRAHTVAPLAQYIQMETMNLNVGALFLLRRASLVGSNASLEAASTSERTIAQKITKELGGLPLALDQAGAYIQETRCSLAQYQQVYQQRRMELLKRRGSFFHDYSPSVATTWTLSFEKVKQQSPAAVDLLRYCALLYPDAIPEELFTNGSMHLGSRLQRAARDPLVFDDTIRILLAYSLLHRDPSTTTLSIHRLVQAVLIDAMPTRIKKQWRERIVRALNEVFPGEKEEEWIRGERLLSHALICADWKDPELISIPATVHLLHKIGIYLRERGQYSKAEPILVHVLMVNEQQSGPRHLDTASSLNSLAILYWRQGKYKQAELLYQRALSIYEEHSRADHPDAARSLGGLAIIYEIQGKYVQCESLYQRALAINERQLGLEHPDTARSLNNLAILYQLQGKYQQAEALQQRALSIYEHHFHLGVERPDMSTCLESLAYLRWRQGKYEQAKTLYQRALSIYEHHLRVEHPDAALCLDSLAYLYGLEGKYEQAEALHQRALAICEQQLGVEHPDTARCLNNLAYLYQRQGKYEQAEALHQRALAICEQQLGVEHPDTAECLNNLAELYQHQEKYEQAEALYQRALAICEQHEPPDAARSLHGLAELSQRQRKYEQAEAFYRRARAIREQHLGSAHPETRETLKAYAAFLRILGRDTEATILDTDEETPAEGNH